MSGRDTARRVAATLLVPAIAVAIAFYEVLGPNAGLFFRDHHVTFRPRWWAVRESLLRGELPALTSGGYGKVPLDHLLNGTYTPGTLILLLGPFDVVYDYFVVFHFLLLGTGVLLLARRLGADWVEAALAAVIAMLAGPIFNLENLLVALIGLSYVPWVLLAAERMIRAPTLGAAALTGLALGFHLQAIIPPVALIDVLAGVGLLLWVRPKPSLLLAGSATLALALGLALASLELVPALEAIRDSARGRGFPYAVSSGWAVGPWMLIELLAPVFWAPPDHPYINPAAITGSLDNPPYFTTLYLGSAIPLIIAGALRRRGRWLGVLALFFLIVAMGRHTPLHRLVASLPLLERSRYAVKYTLIVAVTAAVLVPLGLRTLREHPKRFQTGTLIHLCLLVSLAAMVFSGAFDELLRAANWPSIRLYGLELQKASIIALAKKEASKSLLHAGIFGVAGAAVAYLHERRPALRPRLEKGLCALVVIDLGLAATYAIVPIRLDAVQLPEEAAAALARAPEGTTQYFTDWDPTDPLFLVDDLPQGQSFFQQMTRIRARRGDLPTILAERFEDEQIDEQSNPFHAAMYRLARYKLVPPARERLLARAGVRYVFTGRSDLEGEELARWPTSPGHVCRLVELTNADPYVSGYYRWRHVDPGRWHTGSFQRAFDDEAAQEVALVVGDVESSTTSRCAGRPEVRFSTEGPNGPITARVDARCPALVVAQEILTTGWGVTIDGEEAPFLQANAGYLAVSIPPGTHVVRFEYRSLVREWAPVSLAALLFILFLVVFGRRRLSPGS